MIETFLLFIAIFVLEIILEIDNVTALRRAAEGLPDTPMCRGQAPHALALGVRVGLAYMLFHAVSSFSHLSSSTGHNFLEQLGGVVIILVACSLIINYFQGTKAARDKLANRMKTKKTDLISFLVADAFLSLDTVIAAVAMTTNFKLAISAMVAASVCIMIFHKPLHAWLKLNPRMALIAFVVIGMLGVNLIFASEGIAIPKYALLLVVFVGVWMDGMDKDMKAKKADVLAKYKKRTNGVSSKPKKPSVLARDWREEKAQAIPRASAAPDGEAVTQTVVVPATVDASWTEVVQKAEEVRNLLHAEQIKKGGAYDYAPDGKRILAEALGAPEGKRVLSETFGAPAVSFDVPPARAQDGYTYGTNHSAAMQVGLYGFIFMGLKEQRDCHACGAAQNSIVSVCNNSRILQIYVSSRDI